MNEPKPFASLSSSLLARKGQAKPAMRPQGFHISTEQPIMPHHEDDLGWNDMGHDEPVEAPAPLGLTPMESHAPAEPVALHGTAVPEAVEPPPVVEQQARIERNFAVPDKAPKPAKAPRAQPGSKPKAAFTLRLDGERHLRLRLICAVTHRSAQQIVTQALDDFLASQPGNNVLASLKF